MPVRKASKTKKATAKIEKHLDKQVNFKQLTINQFCEALGITRTTYGNWLHKEPPLPVNKDKTINLQQAVEWLVNYKAGLAPDNKAIATVDLELKAERARLVRAQADEREGLTMLREEHEAIVSARAKSVAVFYQKAAMRNSIHYVGKSLPEIQTLRLKEAEDASKAYLGEL